MLDWKENTHGNKKEATYHNPATDLAIHVLIPRNKDTYHAVLTIPGLSLQSQDLGTKDIEEAKGSAIDYAKNQVRKSLTLLATAEALFEQVPVPSVVVAGAPLTAHRAGFTAIFTAPAAITRDGDPIRPDSIAGVFSAIRQNDEPKGLKRVLAKLPSAAPKTPSKE